MAGGSERVRAARWAVFTIFFVCGAGAGTWFARIPAVQAKHSLDKGGLGLLLLGMSLGALIVLPFAGGIVARQGSDRVTIVAALVFASGLPIAAVLPNPWLLGAGLALFGAALSLLDIAMNTQAVDVERLFGRSIMSSFHGGYSLGGLAGALAGGLVASQGVGLIPHFIAAGALLVVVVIGCRRFMLPVGRAAVDGPRLALPRRGIIGLSLIAFSAFMLEGSIADWAGVFLTDVLGTGEGLAAAGYGGFALTMTIGRLTGDRVAERLGPVIVVRLGGSLSVVGLVMALVSPNPFVAIAGFSLVGIGMATVVPMAFSAAGNAPGFPPGFAIAAVAGMGYGSLLTGPPAIGFLAQATSLRIGLLVPVACGVLIVALASRTRVARGVDPAAEPAHAITGAGD
jgi:MFS family permease